MTPEELLSQPEDQYMSAEQQAFFKSYLEDRQTEHSLQLASALAELKRLEPASDVADFASTEERRQELLRDIDYRRITLRSIDKALARIEAGEYGWCESTGEPIGLQRLLAFPTANLSVEAQHIREVQYRRVG